MEYDKKVHRNFEPIDIIYKPTKDIEIEPLCYFSTDIAVAYSTYYTHGNCKKRSSRVQSCHYCNHYFVQSPLRFEKHLKQCSEKPGIIYNFNNQSLISYEDNFKSKGDLPFTIYFDFETTVPTDNCLDPEEKKMFLVSYVIIVAFHPHLTELVNRRIIVNRSFAHELEELTTISYLSTEQLNFTDQYLINMLKDYASHVFKKKCKNSLARMFSVESALVKKTLLKWFNAKFKRRVTILNPIQKMKYKSKNKVDWQKSECVICKFPLKLDISKFDKPKITYGDYIVRFEYKFLRNIFSIEQLVSAKQITSLQNYYEFFKEYIDICIGLLAFLNSNQKIFINDATENFVQEEFADETLPEIKNTIQKTEIKNAL